MAPAEKNTKRSSFCWPSQLPPLKAFLPSRIFKIATYLKIAIFERRYHFSKPSFLVSMLVFGGVHPGTLMAGTQKMEVWNNYFQLGDFFGPNVKFSRMYPPTRNNGLLKKTLLSVGW